MTEPALSAQGDVPMNRDVGIDRPALLGLLAGLAGMAAAVAAGVFASPVLGVLAGAAALAAGALPLAVVRHLHEVQAELRTAQSAPPAEPPAPRAPAPLVDRETGLPDEWYFHLVVEGRLAAARRQLQPLVVVLLDIEVRSNEGVPSGQVVSSFAGLLRQTLRDSDTACRLGPTTFALVLERTTEEGGAVAAQRLQLSLVRSGVAVGRLAAGVASYPAHGLSADDLVRRARQALARARTAEVGTGLGRVELAQSE